MEKNGKTKEWKEKEEKSTYRGNDWSETPPSILRTNSYSLNHVSCESVFFLCLSYGKKSMSQQTVNCKLTVDSRTPRIILVETATYKLRLVVNARVAGWTIAGSAIWNNQSTPQANGMHGPHSTSFYSGFDFFQNSNTPLHSGDNWF
jgi:hypothetical protein